MFGVSPEARGPHALWDLYKVLRIPALCYIKREVLEMGGVNLYTRVAEADPF